MLKNYFKIALRTFAKDKTFAFITLFGLVIGLASVFIIAAYVKYELSFDKDYSNSDRIYRLAVERKVDDEFKKTFSFPDPLVYTLKDEFPEIEAVSYVRKSDMDFIIDNKSLNVNLLIADSSFFKIFNLPFIAGNAESPLSVEGSMVITESTAKRLFGDQQAIGKDLNYRNYDGKILSYNITGVIKDIPTNTHFQTEAIISQPMKSSILNWRGFSTRGLKYLMLKKGTDVKALDKKILSIYGKYKFPEDVKVILQPVRSIHLYSDVEGDQSANGDIKYVYIFSFSALLILLIACINYMNLTIARSLQRTKEVGMRKVMGAKKRQLSFQFISESVLFFIIALPFAIILAHIFWPAFIKIMEINYGNNFLFDGQFLISVLLGSIVVGIISGAYPAFFLSRLKPISILKDWQKGLRVNMGIRKTLIVFQFVISITLIIATAVIYKQLSLLNNKSLGFDRDYLVTLPVQGFRDGTETFKNELKSGKDIIDATVSPWYLGESYGQSGSMTQPGDSVKNWYFGFVQADNDFFKTMKIKLHSGRFFSDQFPSDTINVDALINAKGKNITNEEFLYILSLKSIILTSNTVKEMGLKEPIEGQSLNLSSVRGTVIGVVDDFIGISLLKKNPMVIIEKGASDYGNTYIRINSKNIPQSIAFIEKTFKKFFPDTVFQYSFMNDEVAKLYKDQQRLATLFTAFALLGILIAVMGLFSLVALTVKQKTKEIGIRKVLGAGAKEIVLLLSGSFIKLILIALVIASAVGWWGMNIWLEDFQYRTTINWWIFVGAGLGCLCFALVVVALQAIRAAAANPVEALRTE